MTDPINSPDFRREEVVAVEAQLDRLEAFYEGTDAVRKDAKKYLPQHERESGDNYTLRRDGVAVPGYLMRTVGASAGRLFSTAPALDVRGLSQAAADWENIDGQGTHGDVWASASSELAIRDGFCLVLVDAPTAPNALVPMPDAQKYRARWIRYEREALLNWRTVVIDGRTALSMLAMIECHDVPDGAFGMAKEERVRVLRRQDTGAITAEVWAERENEQKQKTWQLVEGPFEFRGPKEIPVALIVGGKRSGLFSVRPPLLSLCDKVIEYWQVASDIRHNERMACFPQPVVIGQRTSATGDPAPLVLGPTTGIGLEVGGDFRWAELAGTSLAQLRESQQVRLREIGTMGLSFLVSETRSAETAKSKQLDSAAENATLADAARGIEDGINQCWMFHAAYDNVAPEQAPTISLNKNLTAETLDPQTVAGITAMRNDGLISDQEFRDLLVRGRVFPVEMSAQDAVLAAELNTELAKATVVPDPAPVA